MAQQAQVTAIYLSDAPRTERSMAAIARKFNTSKSPIARIIAKAAKQEEQL